MSRSVSVYHFSQRSVSRSVSGQYPVSMRSVCGLSIRLPFFTTVSIPVSTRSVCSLSTRLPFFTAVSIPVSIRSVCGLCIRLPFFMSSQYPCQNAVSMWSRYVQYVVSLSAWCNVLLHCSIYDIYADAASGLMVCAVYSLECRHRYWYTFERAKKTPIDICLTCY